MTVEYRNALAEVDYILHNTSDELIKKIPNSFLKFIKENKTKNYQFKLNNELPIEELPLKTETKAIISIIYRSFLCSDDQRKKFKIDEKIRLKRQKLKDNNK